MIKHYDALFLMLALVLVVLHVTAAGQGFPLDDSWIHQVYARNLAERGEWAFVPGEPSAASTSPLYTVLLSIGYRLHIPYMAWTHGLGAVALLLCGMIGARLAERLLPDKGYAGPVTGVVLIGAWHLIWAAVAGMETMLFSMFTLLLLAISWRELDERSPEVRFVLLRGGIFGMAAAAATLTRPEGVLLAGLIGLLMLVIRPQGTWSGVILWAIGAGGAFLIFMAPYLLLNLQLTGGLMPNTASAKYAQMAPVVANTTYLARVWEMVFPLIAGAQLLLLPGMIFYIWFCLRRLNTGIGEYAFYLLPVVWAVALILLYAARLPAPFQHGRYVIPALPSLLLSGIVGMLWLANRGQQYLLVRVVSRALLLAAGLVLVYFAFIQGPTIYGRDVAIIEEEMVASAHWIADNISDDELLAIHDIGAVGYFATRPILDIAGLVNPEVIPILYDTEALYQFMQDHDARYLLAFPDQVPGDDVDDPRLCPLFTTEGEAAPLAGGANMTLYTLQWGGRC